MILLIPPGAHTASPSSCRHWNPYCSFNKRIVLNRADRPLEKLNMMFLSGTVGFNTADGVSVSWIGMSRKLYSTKSILIVSSWSIGPSTRLTCDTSTLTVSPNTCTTITASIMSACCSDNPDNHLTSLYSKLTWFSHAHLV